MRKYKDDIKTILQVLMFGIIYLSISTIDNPIVSIIFLGLWIGYLIYNLYSKFQYRKGNANYILFPTVNDQYSKITSVILGLIVCLLSVVAIVWTDDFRLYGALGILVGVLVFFNGIFDLPKGMLKIEGNVMNIAGIDGKIDIRQVKELNIYNDRIVVTNIYNENQRLGNLEIDVISAQYIDNYILNNKKENDLKTINNVC
jgi:Ca2+/Na+ antiporter